MFSNSYYKKIINGIKVFIFRFFVDFGRIYKYLEVILSMYIYRIYRMDL